MKMSNRPYTGPMRSHFHRECDRTFVGNAIAHKQPVYGDRKICNQPIIF
ncbi:MAG: hypothetical protein GDA56_29855 [Hormoscilla sp. GM7CHS1pb]|nr:hypothetical protein [Hormoscilla sp. GM7CHS1pb]